MQLKSAEGSLLFSFFVPFSSSYFLFQDPSDGRTTGALIYPLVLHLSLSSPARVGPLPDEGEDEDENEPEMEKWELKPLLGDCDSWTFWTSNDTFNIFYSSCRRTMLRERGRKILLCKKNNALYNLYGQSFFSWHFYYFWFALDSESAKNQGDIPYLIKLPRMAL